MDFEQAWKIWPRKTAKAHAKKMWNRLTDEEKKLAYEAIPKHLAHWEAMGTEPNFIPHFASWCNPILGRRWEDELPEGRKLAVDPKRWAEERARALGMSPRAGEGWDEFIGRVRTATIRAA